MSLVRTFLGLALDDDTREAIADLIERLRARCAGARLRWVEPENLHLTVKFLGNLEPDRLPDVFRLADEIACRTAPFLIDLRGTGCFPDARFPRIVYAGCDEGSEPLRVLVARAEAEGEALGFDRDTRPYAPHLTLARVPEPRGGRNLGPALAGVPDETWGVTHAREVTVFMSERKREGPVYSPMHRAEFRGREGEAPD